MPCTSKWISRKEKEEETELLWVKLGSRDFRRASSDKTKGITDEYLLNRFISLISHLHRIYRSVNKSSVDIIQRSHMKTQDIT